MTPVSTAIQIVYPITDPGLRQAAALRLASTRKSLDWLLRRDGEGLALFSDVHAGQMIVALSVAERQPVGMVSWTQAGRDAFRTSGRAFAALYGPFSGRLRHAVYRVLGCAVAPAGAVYVSSLWVHPDWRSRGVGLPLMRAATRAIEGRLVADIRRDDRRMRLLLARLGLRPAPVSPIVFGLRLAGYCRMERPPPRG